MILKYSCSISVTAKFMKKLQSRPFKSERFWTYRTISTAEEKGQVIKRRTIDKLKVNEGFSFLIIP